MSRTLTLLFLLAALVTAQPSSSSPALLERELDRITQISGGVTGVTAIHLETGKRVSLRGSERFPMASTFKIPIAVQLLHLVDQGKERLDRMIELQPSDLHPGSGTLADLFNQPGVALSIRNLLELMLLISDNSATDVLLRVVGGADAVNGRLAALQVEGITVSRPTLGLISDAIGVPQTADASQHTMKKYSESARLLTPDQRAAARKAFEADERRDTSTPDGMATLLAKLHRGEILGKDSTALLLDILDRCRTGNARLKGLLPAGTPVAHKTGSILGTANDVGIVRLPENQGHVVVAAFVKNSTKGETERDRAIAEAARTLYDYFLFMPKGN